MVELFGLLLSPFPWTHHWVWLVPLMIWLIHGPLCERRGARILGWGWLALTIPNLPWALTSAQPTVWQIGRPWYLAWAGLVYIAATMVTLARIANSGTKTASTDPRPRNWAVLPRPRKRLAVPSAGCFADERVAGLRDQRGVVEAGSPAERGHDVVIDVAGAHDGVEDEG